MNESQLRSTFAHWLDITPDIYYYTSDFADKTGNRSLYLSLIACGLPVFLDTVPDNQTLIAELSGLNDSGTNWRMKTKVVRHQESDGIIDLGYADLSPDELRDRISVDVDMLSKPTLFVHRSVGQQLTQNDPRTPAEIVATLLASALLEKGDAEFSKEFVSKVAGSDEYAVVSISLQEI